MLDSARKKREEVRASRRDENESRVDSRPSFELGSELLEVSSFVHLSWRPRAATKMGKRREGTSADEREEKRMRRNELNSHAWSQVLGSILLLERRLSEAANARESSFELKLVVVDLVRSRTASSASGVADKVKEESQIRTRRMRSATRALTDQARSPTETQKDYLQGSS